MPRTQARLRRFVPVLYCLLLAASCFSQPVPMRPPAARAKMPVTGRGNNQRIASTEICGNNIDDDGNGLTDNDDFGCYYNSPAASGCPASKIVWACFDDGLYWSNPATGAYRYVGKTDNMAMGDIAWSPDGHLYGIDFSYTGLWEIDPYTGHIRSLGTPNGFYPMNALTAGKQGDLYMTAKNSDFTQTVVLKLSLATMQTSVIVNLAASNLASAGDLTFLNGYLYLSCVGNKIARIDITTGNMQVIPIQGSSMTGFGLMTPGDGYLYISNGNSLYRMDPTTMRVEANPWYTFPSTSASLYGVSDYAEQCNAPSCKLPDASLGDDTVICPGTTVALTPLNTTGIASYHWQDGSTALAFEAPAPGTYWLEASNPCGTNRDSIVVLAATKDCDRMMKVPNAFSPAGNSNMLFRPVITGPLLQYEFMVYNRWGQLIYHTNNRKMGWDGRVNGQLQNTGVFAWVCNYRFSGQPPTIERGTVLLMR